MRPVMQVLHRVAIRTICLVKDHQWDDYRQQPAPVGWLLFCSRCGALYPFRPVPSDRID